MHQPYSRAILLGLSIAIAALLFSLAIGPAQSDRGAAGPTFAMAASPVLAVIATVAVFLVGIGFAGLVGRPLNAVVGLFVLGCGLALLAMRSGTVQDVAFGQRSLSGLTVEGLVWTGLVAFAAIAVFRIAGPLPDAVPIDEPRVDGVLGSRALLAQLAGIASPAVVWLVAVSPSKGQALGATVLGGMVAGLVGRIIAPRTPPILIFASPILFGAIGYLLASTQLGAMPIDLAFVTRSLSRLAYPMPIDYAAGSLVGVAMGIGWSRSFLKFPTPSNASA